ncbi:phosphoribosyltransferase [Saccharomonospora sp. NPDC046836]|uniref:phosphoribosyltransferase n=1 Tax=Saccharomonospora sp. NPDC046836 TaxID=3156921 RepID=UPI0033E78984
MPFVDRADAGRRLAGRLAELRGQDVVVLGLPRGGVAVAGEIARALQAPLDVIVVRKLGVPYQPELAMGAIGEDGVRVIDPEVMRACQVTPAELAGIEATERTELERRARHFRGGRARIPLRGRIALIVDDGVATGSTARAACRVARAEGAKRVVLALPVGAPRAVAALRREADSVVCLETPSWFHAVGQWYEDFQQVTDDEVLELLHNAGEPGSVRPARSDPSARDEEVEVLAGRIPLAGHLTIPEHSPGIVVFAHGSGSSRHSPRNRHVAGILHDAGLGTLLFDLLTRHEEVDRRLVFDIQLLAGRLRDATVWLSSQPGCREAGLGYFGASTGAAAALWAAADSAAGIAAIVSRGGRPDLATEVLHRVRAATLLIVGGNDSFVLELNRAAAQRLRCEKQLAVVPGASHLFEEPGTLDHAARLARDWFLAHFGSTGRTT